METFTSLNYVAILLAFLLSIVTYSLYRLHADAQAIVQQSLKSQQTKFPIGAPVPTLVPKSKSTATHVHVQSSTQVPRSLSVKETVDILGKWAEEIEAAGEMKISLKGDKKKKFLGGLFGERIVVEGFRGQEKKVRLL